LRELVSSTEQSGQHWLDAELHRSQSELLLRLDPPNVSMAEDTFRRALEIARTQQTKTFELRSAIGLAHLYRANGRAEAIPEMLAPVLVDFDTERDLPEIEEAETLLKRGEAGRRGNW
jgi:predicted ATPase